jgi:hypothetical protein
MISTNDAIDMERLRPDYLYRLSILLRPARPDFLCYVGFSPGKRIWDGLRHHWCHSCIIYLLVFSRCLPLFSAFRLAPPPSGSSHHITLEPSRLHCVKNFLFGMVRWMVLLFFIVCDTIHMRQTTNDLTNIHTLLNFDTVEYHRPFSVPGDIHSACRCPSTLIFHIQYPHHSHHIHTTGRSFNA